MSEDGTDDDERSARRGVLASSAVMAAGTVVSRLSGFVRLALLGAALGASLHADVFNIANTIPNMLYILLAGGVFNAVLVPQLVRAIERDADGGERYTNLVITVGGLFLAGVTAVLVLAAPVIMRVFVDPAFFDDPALSAHRASIIDLARYCLPQVFFYGMFALVGQVLNSRGRFGPMMWAPIANNLVTVAVLSGYLVVFGPTPDPRAAYTTQQELVLGLGSTLGIVIQLAVLVPYLRAAGVRYRPRFDLRGSGLGHTARLAGWTIGFVVVNQVAYTVVVRIGSAGGIGEEPGTGYTIYSATYLLMILPHSIATVSLATAMLPRLSRLAAGQQRGAVGSEVAGTVRIALAIIAPAAVLMPILAVPVSTLVFGYGAAAPAVGSYAASFALWAPVLVLFTVHYLMLRGFYALEQTRTVFLLQCVIATVNIAGAVLLTRSIDPVDLAPRLVLAYGLAYLVGAAASWTVLRRVTGTDAAGLAVGRMLAYVVRLAVSLAPGTALAWLVVRSLDDLVGDTGRLGDVAVVLAAAAALLVTYLPLARLLRVEELSEMLDLVLRRLPGRARRS